MFRSWSSSNKSPENSFTTYCNQAVKVIGNNIDIGGHSFSRSENLNCGERLGMVPIEQIAQIVEHYNHLTHGEYNPQLAALICAITGNPRALDSYFPIVSVLDEIEIRDFYAFIQDLTQHPGLDLQLWGENRTNLTDQMQSDVSQLVAGHLAEIFFYRRDILERFLTQPRHIWLYVTPRAFVDDGGQAGGDYDPETESLQLVLSRLVEGFYGPTPGVAPFLHEFGHMLDAFDAGTGRMGHGDGLLPGLSPNDGPIYTPRARELFIRGKRIELERYLIRYRSKSRTMDPLPIGHPYVFQNDAEFAAGYFEMFFRNPHYFAEQNPVLFDGYVELFRYDSRRAWKQDFQFYINQNRDFYLSGIERPWKPGITIPDL
jgi:hypothetical protein